MKRKRSIAIAVVISVVLTIIVFSSAGYFIYHKYVVNELAKKMIMKNLYNSVKGKGIHDILSKPLKDLAESDNLNEVIIEKLEEFTKMDAFIDEIVYEDEMGLNLKNVKLKKNSDTIVIRDVYIDPSKGIILKNVKKSTDTGKNVLTADNIHIGLNTITVKKFKLNPSREITVETPGFYADKVIGEFDLIDILDKKTFILSDLKAFSFELLLAKRPYGVWLLMDTLKGVLGKLDLPDYTNFLEGGLVGTDGKVSLIDEDMTLGGSLELDGLDIRFNTHAGSFKQINIEGELHDKSLGNFNLTGILNLEAPELDIRLGAKNLMVSEDFFKRVPNIGQNLWKSYKPIGDLSLDGSMKFLTKGKERIFEPLININFNDIELTYVKWPFKATRGSGQIMLLDKKINIRGLQGYVFEDEQHGTKVELDAIMEIGKPAMNLTVKAYDVEMTEGITSKLPKVCKKLYETFNPAGKADLTVTYLVDDRDKVESDYVVELDCKNWSLTFPTIPIPLKNVNGRVVINKSAPDSLMGKCSGRVQLREMNGYFDDGVNMRHFSFDGEFDMGGPSKILNLNIPALNMNSHVIKYLPAEYQNILKDFTPAGKADLNIVYDNTRGNKDADLSITVDCKGCDFIDSRFPAPLHSVMGLIEINRKSISTDHIIGRCYNGLVKGSVRIDIEEDGYKYDGVFDFTEMDMNELFHEVFKADQDWPGLLSGKVKFNRGYGDKKSFDASGRIVFEKSNIANVPVALSIFKILNLGFPSKVVFNKGYVNFLVKDNIIEIDEAKISSDSIELVARGTVGFDGKLDLYIIVGFSDNFLLDIPVVGKLMEFVVGGVRKQLTKVHVGGTFKQPKSSLAMFDPIKRPIKREIDLIPKKESTIGTSTSKSVDKDKSRDKD